MKLQLTLFLLGFLLPAIFNIAFSQNTGLQNFLDTAQQNNPQLQDYKNKERIAAYENQIVNANYRKPSIGLNAQWMKAPVIKGTGYDAAITNGANYTAVAGISYQLFTQIFLQTKHQQNNLQIEKAKWNYEATGRQLRRKVTDQYLQCLADQQHIENLRKQHEVLKDQVNIADALATDGIVKGSDVMLLRIEKKNLERNTNQLESQLRQDLHNLFAMCGIQPYDTGHLQVPNMALSDTLVQKSRFQRQFLIDSLQAENKLDRFSLKYQPQVSAFADAGLNAVDLQQPDNSVGFSFGLNFTLHVFDGDQKKIARSQTKVAQQSIAGYSQFNQNRRQQKLAGYHQKVNSTEQQLSVLGNQSHQYEQLLKLYRKELQQGDISVNDYLVAFRNHIQLQQQQIDQQKQKYAAINAYNYWNW